MEEQLNRTEAEVGRMRAEASRMREELTETEAAAQDMQNELQLESITLDGLIADLVLMQQAEQALLEILFPQN
ncbi:hypothetical protein SLEP1_g16025 [Rubroshorea leprosula]|uniref:Uncharacterized protein n=1 Tax=Rubroshorea leprosula TaxID=152421 RepID=A0AAV5IVD1_9ROSI|nr:hypothetical protein SLEP1_g16025 [Rubroshorea leprosula]